MQVSARKRIYAVITLFFPLTLIVVLELLLRAFNYGPDLSLFTRVTLAGKPLFVMNPAVKNRYFTLSTFTPATSEEPLLVPKPKDTFRIFCLGESTMAGYPYWFNGAPSSFLRDRLKMMFPSKRVEIINVGMTAINSFAVADMAHDLVSYEPDLFVVYDGHNEFYGALGVSSNQTVGGMPWVTRLYLTLIHFKTFYLLREVAGKIAGWFGNAAAGDATGTMMESLARGHTIRYGTPPYWRALRTFESNLSDLKETCRTNRVPLILSTQVSNLRTLPPFDSGESPGKDEKTKMSFEETFTEGKNLYDGAQFEAALEKFRVAESADSIRGDTQFWIARCLDTLGDKSAALQAYIRARDYDELRFRASTDFNNVIRRMADGQTTVLADIESLFATQSPSLLIDSTLIFEHLHPRARGYFLIGKAFAESIRRLGLLAEENEWKAADTLNERALWEARPVTPLDDIIAERRVQILTSRWPFRQGREKLPAAAPGDFLGAIADRMLAGQLSWENGHIAVGERYELERDYVSAAREFRALVDQYPFAASPYLRLARDMSEMGNLREAERLCRQSLDVQQTAYACRILGKLATNDGRLPEAIDWFSRAIKLGTSVPELLEDRYNLAVAYVNSGMTERGILELKDLAFGNSRYPPAQRFLQEMGRQAQ